LQMLVAVLFFCFLYTLLRNRDDDMMFDENCRCLLLCCSFVFSTLLMNQERWYDVWW
jgi:hypothetical protein